MKIKDILRRKGAKVVTVRPGCTIQEAIRTLCKHRIGAALVEREDGALVGIVTERDIMMDCGHECSQLEKLADPCNAVCPRVVDDIMSTDLIIGVPDDGLEYVMDVMTRNHVRHLPILEDGGLVGIVSIGDVIHAHLSETAFENRFLKDYIQGTA